MNINTAELLNYSYPELVTYLRFAAGMSDAIFNGTVGGKDNLNLQQIPEEFAKLLLFLKKLKNKSYLELGIGHGGSFFLTSLFQLNLETCHAVDNCEYQKNIPQFKNQHISIKNKIKYLSQIKQIDNINFFNNTTDNFFKLNNTTYDIIFIDADHSYKGVKKDFENSIKILNENGYIIFHDIANVSVGVKKLWDELDNSKKIKEFIYSSNCGIGIYKP